MITRVWLAPVGTPSPAHDGTEPGPPWVEASDVLTLAGVGLWASATAVYIRVAA